jgi:DNA-directed RNA polymerase specialized sigma subunit
VDDANDARDKSLAGVFPQKMSAPESRQRRRAEEPSWQDTAARLREIPVERLETLREREQLAVRLYYALDGGPAIPPTLKELASRIGVHAARSAQQIVGRAVAALLDPAAADPTGADVFA